jgi:hypothetical protein
MASPTLAHSRAECLCKQRIVAISPIGSVQRCGPRLCAGKHTLGWAGPRGWANSAQISVQGVSLVVKQVSQHRVLLGASGFGLAKAVAHLRPKSLGHPVEPPVPTWHQHTLPLVPETAAGFIPLSDRR